LPCTLSSAVYGRASSLINLQIFRHIPVQAAAYWFPFLETGSDLRLKLCAFSLSHDARIGAIAKVFATSSVTPVVTKNGEVTHFANIA